MTKNSNTQDPKKTTETQATIDVEKDIRKLAGIDTDSKAGIQILNQEGIQSEGRALVESGVRSESTDGKNVSAPVDSAQKQSRDQSQSR
ncbi:MAG: hypothetical protein ISQ32_05960 [Rickettsiales bacterium]|nr:hypothetical protein [Rickettsiales bacterium]